MDKTPDSGKSPPSPSIRRMRLAARIVSVPIILFTLFFVIAHITGQDEHTVPDYPPIENLLPVLMTLSVLSLGFAWHRETAGGVLCLTFFTMNLILYWIIRGYFFPGWALLTLSPVFLCGVLFLLTGVKTGKARKS